MCPVDVGGATADTACFPHLRIMKRLAASLTVALLIGVAAYLVLTPASVRPVAWESKAAPGYAGAFAVNSRLAAVSIVPLGTHAAPEHIVLAKDGRLYLSAAAGNILRMQPDGTAQEVFANTGGRVLGFDFDGAGNLIAADSHRGLLSINPDRKVTVLADSADGVPIGFADAVIVARNGRVYFTDATTRFPPGRPGHILDTEAAALLDVVEHSSTGRVLEYDPATRSTRVVARGLCFANGIALSGDERSLLVAETGAYRVWRIAVTAKQLDVRSPSPLANVVLDNLPGLPDNLMRGLDGRIWVGLPEPRAPFLDDFAAWPTIRQLALRLPKSLRPTGTPYGHVVAFLEDGRVVDDLQDPSGAFDKATGVTETRDRLYLQTLNHRGLGWLPRVP
jgi:sugar lactone lactonase YvrE